MTSIAPAVREAVASLRRGGVIAMPSDTLYALVAAAEDTPAVARVFSIKGRDASNPLPLFVASREMAERVGRFSPAARRLAERFWPGALTVVLPRREEFQSAALAGGDTVGLRVPANEVALAIIEALGAPVTATSANRSGGADPTTAAEVRRQLGDDVDLIIDAGECPVGVPSTIVDCTRADPLVLRQGAIGEESIRDALA